jgi:hypothetical protein
LARYQLNLKLVVDVETDAPPEAVQARLDGLFETAKTRVRQLVRNAPVPIAILAWHYHASSGPVDEPEP